MSRARNARKRARAANPIGYAKAALAIRTEQQRRVLELLGATPEEAWRKVLGTDGGVTR